VLRGGSWMKPPTRLRSAFRGNDASDSRSGETGLRVARTLAP
jgi:formylglycine-generating enzyme required for sulfatase activity